MTRLLLISASISRLAISLLLLVSGTAVCSAQKFLRLSQDTVPMFRGLAVSTDVVGLAQIGLSDYGQYEGAVRLNLHDQYFPIIEMGYGKANHTEDEVTGITYKTGAPYFRVGCDVNLAKNIHSPNRIYAGLRYAYTSYKVDIMRQPFPDPVWQWDTAFGVSAEPCYQHWAEVVMGIDAQVLGPLHLGWSVRYKRQIAHNDGVTGKTWYVPGYGTQGSSRLGASFNVIIDI